MWSRVIVPINRNLVQRSFICLQSRDIHRSTALLGFKHEVTKTTDKRYTKDRYNSTRTNRDLLHENPKSEIPLFAHDDPDIFGSKNRQVPESEAPDEGDIAVDEHYGNIPLRRNQLRPKMYTDMVKKFINQKRIKEAIDVLEVRMVEDRVKPTYYVYELLIMECGRCGYTKKAFQLYNRMKKRGLRVTGPIYAALFSACANTIHPSAGLELAKNLRKIMIQNRIDANEIIYNAMIKAFGRCGDIDTAFLLVDEMKDKKLRMKIDTMNHLLQACCSDREYGFRHALLVWHKIYLRKMVPDVHSFNLMIRCTRDCGIGDPNEMRRVIAHILQSSQAAVKLKAKGDKIFLLEDKPKARINSNENENDNLVEQSESKDELVANEVCDQMPNLLTKLPHLGSLVQLSMVQTPEDRLTLLGGVKGIIAEFEETKVRPNVKTFSQLLYTIPSTREAEHELIQQMRYMRVRADIDFFNLLMKKRSLRLDYDGAKQVLDMIAKVRLVPDIVTYGVLAMGCKTREQFQEFRDQLTEKGVRLNIEILGAQLRNATKGNSYNFDFVNDVLEYAMSENIKPSERFAEILRNFKNVNYYRLTQEQDNDEEWTKYNAFYRVYKKWQSQMELKGLSADEAKKLLKVHPWKQIKEPEGDGIEPVYNINTRRLWKRQNVLKKLTPKTIETIDRPSLANAEKKEQIENPVKKKQIENPDSNDNM